MGQSIDCTITPSCDPDDPSEFYSDPDDCTGYYTCTPNHELQHSFCDEGLMFDITNGCVEYDDKACYMCEPSCRFTCPAGITTREATFIADKSDCGIFHICSQGNIISDPIQCIDEHPDEPYFDGNGCQADESKCCDSSLVYCWEEKKAIPDPSDCHNFYYCSQIGLLPKGPFSCTGETPVFDPQLGDCSSDASCTTTLTPVTLTTATITTILPDTPTTATTILPDTPTTATTILPDTPTTATTILTDTPTTATTILPDTPTTATTILPDTPTTATTILPDTPTTATTILTDTPTTATTTTILPNTPTTAITTPTTTITTTTIPSSCKDSLICEVVGPYPVCTNMCTIYFFYCDLFDIGHEAELRTCKYPYVFDPSQVMCVYPDDCPFSFKAMVPKMGVI
ncbi:hypothetical protein Pmani_011767 [Petrolisthes manimaculis]|uniref:Chitin-binding type-2 domain-containing protein n=1 Tax=Petrolisthes manimaculis TaxID=1843537 RepID=A0AAE1UAW4_9EUCA|nr:hypothetical protein Pmani_011767 [Petrolisthes manimaculis]